MPTLPPLDRSLLAFYSLPKRSYEPPSSFPVALRSVWSALQAGTSRVAAQRARAFLQEPPSEDTLRAAALYALAAAAWQEDHAAIAEQHARASLKAEPNQWAAHRILLEMLAARHAFEQAYLHLTRLELPDDGPDWDVPLPARQRHLAAAAWAWQIGDWEAVATYLACAYPKGLLDMPVGLLEDGFRLALYRKRPADAAEAAALLIANRSIESTDDLLQAIVHQGWTEQALPLYRSVYADAPDNELLRRRLIALCIREGVIDEARELSSLGALKTT